MTTTTDRRVWLNAHEIDDCTEFFDADPVLGPAARWLAEFRDAVDQVSDGWAYWSAPAHAAGRLMALLHAHRYAGMGAYPRIPRAVPGDVRACVPMITRFLTTKGRAAGMTITTLRLIGGER